MFTDEEMQTMMDALDALEAKPMGDGLMLSMLSLGISSASKEEKHIEMENTMNQAKAESRAMRDRIILLKAKLIQMQDKETASSAFAFMRLGGK